jgi:hypothetical protein
MTFALPRTHAFSIATRGLPPAFEACDLSAATHEIRFANLFREGRAMSFPCDDHGCVDLDGLSDRARNNYLYARAMVGRDFASPIVRPRDFQ